MIRYYKHKYLMNRFKPTESLMIRFYELKYLTNRYIELQIPNAGLSILWTSKDLANRYKPTEYHSSYLCSRLDIARYAPLSQGEGVAIGALFRGNNSRLCTFQGVIFLIFFHSHHFNIGSPLWDPYTYHCNLSTELSLLSHSVLSAASWHSSETKNNRISEQN
jgi:hypothetical protein